MPQPVADPFTQQAQRLGISRNAYIAYLMKQQNMTGQNGTGANTGAPPAPAAPHPIAQQQPVDNRGPLQRLMDALSGNPSGH